MMIRVNRLLMVLAVCAAFTALGLVLAAKFDGGSSSAQPLIPQPINVIVHDDTQIQAAVKTIESHADGMKVILPMTLPDPRLHLRALQFVPPLSNDPNGLRQIVMDYSVEPPDANGIVRNPTGLRMQITQQSNESTFADGDLIDISVPGVEAREVHEGGAVGLLLTGHGKSFLVAVFGDKLPDQSLLTALARDLASR